MYKATENGNVDLTPAEEKEFLEKNQAHTDATPLRDMAYLRSERNVLLVSSDWTQSSDSPLDDETKDDWATYRQELRDLPATTEDPADPSWPEVPE